MPEVFNYLKELAYDREGPFEWVNQGAAKVRLLTEGPDKGKVWLKAPAGAGDNWRIRKKRAPHAEHYQVTARIRPLLFDTYGAAGLVLRENASTLATRGRFVFFGVYVNNDPAVANLLWNVAKYTNPTTFSANYAAVGGIGVALGDSLWLRVIDDGANRRCQFSLDGERFLQVHSVGRTDFCTANEVGLAVNAYNATYDASAVLLSWSEQEWITPADS